VSSRPDTLCPLFHLSGRRVIPSGLKTDQHNPSGQRVRSVRTSPLYREGSVQVTSVRMFQQHVRTPLSTQSVSEFFPSSKKGKINQPSGRCGTPPDACLFNARIAIQISPSGRQLALFRTRVQRIWKLPIRLQPSGRLPVMVRTRA
jgi:hypothetical protein